MTKEPKTPQVSAPAEHVVSTKDAAAYLQVTERRIQQLAAERWVEPVRRGRWHLVALFAGYVASLKDEDSRKTKSAADSRVRDARAAEIERRMAREDRDIIALEEAMGAFDEATGHYLQSMSGLPARITRDTSERRRIEAICDEERQRLATSFGKGRTSLRTGVPTFDPSEEDDAG